MMRTDFLRRPFGTFFLSAVLGAIVSSAACTTQEEEENSSTKADIAASNKESTGYYHWSQGGEILPLFALRALRVDLNGKKVSFMSPENLASYGLMADPVSDANPLGLPVGLTVAHAADTGLVSVGITCSACHAGEIVFEAQGKRTRSRIDGAPGHFSADAFKQGIQDGLDNNIGSGANAAEKAAFFARALVEAARTSRQFEDFDGAPDTAVKRFKMLWTVIESKATGATDIRDIIDKFDLPESRKQLLMARYYSMSVKPDPKETRRGPNRTDPFAVGSNYMFNGFDFHCTPQSPMRYQPLFEMEGKAWYDYTGNTNSINQRNVIEAMAVGGVTALYGDNPTLATSVNFPNLGKLEKAVYQIKTPTWPDALSYDATLAKRGREIYEDKCAHCHEPKRLDSGLYDVNIVPLATIGTDDRVIQQYLSTIRLPTVTGNLGTVGNEIVPAIQQKYCAEAKLTPQQCLELDDAYDPAVNPKGRRTNPGFTTDAVGYQADILDGAWAFGTYLHNGSVPTIADLLEPASKRPKKFATGHVLYDSKRLGYVVYDSLTDEAKREGATTMLDTTLPGNSNAGHEGEQFGTNLSASDKSAVIEYLKKHISMKR